MHLNLRGIKNTFFMSLTPLLYRFPTIALYDRAAASRKEEFGILAVLSHSHNLCDQHVHYTNALAFRHVIFRLSSNHHYYLSIINAEHAIPLDSSYSQRSMPNWQFVILSRRRHKFRKSKAENCHFQVTAYSVASRRLVNFD